MGQKKKGKRAPNATLLEKQEYINEFMENPEQNKTAFALSKGRDVSTCWKWIRDKEIILAKKV